MSFETFEHKADIGVRGKGKTLNIAFEECAKALVSVMTQIDSITPIKSHVLNLSANNEGALLVLFLNELLFLKDKKKMLYSKYRVEINEELGKETKEEAKAEIKNIKDDDKKISLKAVVFGEKIDSKKHEFKVDAKAATYSQLEVKKEGNIWVAQCIIDV